MSTSTGPRRSFLFLSTAILLAMEAGATFAEERPDLLWQRGGHGGLVYALAYSPQGDVFATASLDNGFGMQDRTIKIWRAWDGILVRTIRPPDAPTGITRRGLALSGDGRVLAAAHNPVLFGTHSFVDLWEIATGQLRHTIAPGGNSVSSVKFSLQSSTLAVANNAGAVKLYDVDGQERQTLTTTGGSGLAFSADESRFASTTRTGGAIVLWHRNPDGTYSEDRILVGPAASDSPLAFSPKGDLLVSGAGNTIAVWNIANGTFRTIQDIGGIGFLAFAPPEGALLASGGSSDGAGREIRLWDLTTGDLAQRLGGNVNWIPNMDFSPDGQHIAHLVYAREAKIWRRNDDGEYEFLSYATGHTDTAFAVAFSPDGQTLASGAAVYNLLNAMGEVKLWNAADGRLLQTLSGHTQGVYGVGFSADGDTLASAAWDRTIRVWQRPWGQDPYALRQVLTDHTDRVNSAVFSDNDLLASASRDQTIRLWQRRQDGTFELFQTLDEASGGHAAEVEPLAFSPDGSLLVSGGHDDTVKIWMRQTNGTYAIFQTLVGHSDEVESVAISSDERLIASGSDDHTIHLWMRGADGTYQLWTILEGHQRGVHGVAFSGDDQTLVSGGDTTIRFWSLDDGTNFLTYDEETGTGLEAVRFSPDGALFSFARTDATVSVACTPERP